MKYVCLLGALVLGALLPVALAFEQETQPELSGESAIAAGERKSDPKALPKSPANISAPARLAKPRLLAIFAHPDDDTTCSGTLARAAAAGWDVSLIHATSGGGGRDVSGRSLQGAALAAEREKEAVESLKALGIVTPPLFLRLNSGALRQNETQVVARLADEIRRLTPDVILTFGSDGFTGHPTHIAIGKATDKASREAAPKAALYHVALGQRLPGWAKAADAPIPDGVTPPANLVTVQVGEYQSKRLEALKSYRTQWTPEVLGRLMEFHKAYLFEEFIWAGGANGADGKWVGP